MTNFVDTSSNYNHTSKKHLHSPKNYASSRKSLISSPCSSEKSHSHTMLPAEVASNHLKDHNMNMVDSINESFQSPSTKVRKDIYDFDEGDEFVFGSLAIKPSTPQRLAVTTWTDDQKECLEAAKQIIKSNVYSSIIIRTYPPKRKQQEASADADVDPTNADSETSFVVKKRKSSWTEEDEKWFRGKIDELLQARSISSDQMKEILESSDAKARLFGFLESASLYLHRSENSLLTYMRAIFEVTGYERRPVQEIALETTESSIPVFDRDDAEYIHGCVLSFCDNEGITLEEFGHRECDPSIHYKGHQSLYNEILLGIQKQICKKSLSNYIKLVYCPKNVQENYDEESFQRLYQLVSEQGTKWSWIATQMGLPSKECALLWKYAAKSSKFSLAKSLSSSPKSSPTSPLVNPAREEPEVHTLNNNEKLMKSHSLEDNPNPSFEDTNEQPLLMRSRTDENKKQSKKKNNKKKKKKNGSKFYAGDSLQLLEHVQNSVPPDAKITADLDWDRISSVMSRWTNEELKLQTDNLISTVKGWKKKPLQQNIKAAIDELKTLPQGTLKQINRKI
ncbi:myb family protein Eta2 [Schizosaccharomyces cryophilus OY26]|uniref:Myb family protein Eta2 n=1 Tax=Schizosaccharomyces cryophilus (strain OY26 / ATCC MYA-4695 / CBS 11777 / NBRC 106824 / NRRL Y48691) TaxID=653667 RepID=S9W0C4_SCHCR|nr:myb family protein Eta2 [Schizosaccharomyces cryophilus OY26]EPY53313.1 myb family protein Eta2 [Schizosaccharomyces cryophilus OY26]